VKRKQSVATAAATSSFPFISFIAFSFQSCTIADAMKQTSLNPIRGQTFPSSYALCAFDLFDANARRKYGRQTSLLLPENSREFSPTIYF
jgi:hypothetical protein